MPLKILPHGRLQEWVAEEQGYFAAEGLAGTSHRSADLRYKGQGYDLNVPYTSSIDADFHALHQRRYGFSNESRPIEVVNVRVRMVAAP